MPIFNAAVILVGMNSRRLAQSWPYPRHTRFVELLRQAAARWFAERGHGNLKHPYILSKRQDWRDNLILREVAEYIDQERERRSAAQKGFPLHKYVHHGLSSQVMVFNLLGPLVVRGDLSPLRSAIEEQGLLWPDGHAAGCFEYEDRTVFNEDSGQPTSVDFVVSVDAKPSVFVEAKLVEPEFGGCSVFAQGDCDGRNPAADLSMCYLHHIGRRYWTLLEQHGFLQGSMSQQALCVLAQHYQFFREMLFAVELGGTFVLLCDDRSPTFAIDGPHGPRGLMPLLMEFVPDDLKSRVGVVSIRQVANRIEESGRHEWIGEFRTKYGLDR